jgi:hypothetical protein
MNAMPGRRTARRRFVTALGPTAELTGAFWTLDLTSLPIFHGLSVISRALGELLIEQARDDVIDVVVERAVNPRENPELLNVLGISRIKILAEQSIMSRLAEDTEHLQDVLRVVFGTLQRQRYRDALFPANGTPWSSISRPRTPTIRTTAPRSKRSRRQKLPVSGICASPSITSIAGACIFARCRIWSCAT